MLLGAVSRIEWRRSIVSLRRVIVNEETLFHLTLEKSPHERAAFLEKACAGDAMLRQRVEVLLHAHDNPDSFLKAPLNDPFASEAKTLNNEAAAQPDARPKRDETALFESDEDLRDTPTGVIQTQSESANTPMDEDLSFLQPSQKPDSLGRLDKYEILSVVGKGGFGVVLKGFDESLHRIVAIKVMSPHMALNGTARQRFVREARTAAAVMHENVVTIHEVNGDAKIPFLAMQFVSGITLNDKIEKVGALGIKEILRIGMQIAEGLAAAHKQGLVHRDIKPANILLENAVERVKITDFGLARAVDDASITQSGAVAGTPMYMSPEQANGEAVDHRSDLFSLGSVLYVMCTGRPPFRANSTMAVMKRVIDDTPSEIRPINPDVPDWLCDIVAKLHAKLPADRFQTAREVADVLGEKLADMQAGRAGSESPRRAAPVTVASTPKVRATGSPKSQRPVRMSVIIPAIAAFALLLCLIPAGIVLLSYFSRSNPNLDHGGPPKRDDKLIVMTDDRSVRVEVLPEVGGGHMSIGETSREHGFKLPEGRYQIQARKAGVLVFQEWIRLGGAEPKTIQVNSDWVQLFNGQSLTGWKTHPEQPGDWKIEDGILVGRAAQGPSHLFSERGDLADLHFRVEAKLNDKGDSGQLFRCEYGLNATPLGPDALQKQPLGYEANTSFPNDFKTGSLWGAGWPPIGPKESHIAPDTWFTQEVIARGNHIVIKVNGKTTVDFVDPIALYRRGHLAGQAWALGTVVHFKKIEIKELPPTKATADPPPASPLPQLPADVLPFFVGTWKMEAVIGDPKLNLRGNGVQTFELVANGKFLRGHDTEDSQQFETLCVQSFNVEEQIFQSWFYSSNGDITGPTEGTWDAGRHVLTWKEKLGDR